MTLELAPDAVSDNFDTAALERGHEAMKAIVPSMEGVHLIITRDFVGAVRESHENAEYAANYAQERGTFGSAMAKTIPRSDGTIHVVIDARLLVKGQGAGVPERTFAHEGYHVAIAQRDEEGFNPHSEEEEIKTRLEGMGLAEIHYLAWAAIACEEFRIELALGADWPGGQDASGGQWDNFPGLLEAFDEELRKLSHEYQADPDIAKISKAVTEQFHSVLTAVGYVAAAMQTGGLALPEISAGVKQRVLGPAGARVIERLRELPGADQPTRKEDLQATEAEVSELAEAWTKEIGFHWEDMADGKMFFHVLKPQKWLSMPRLRWPFVGL